ncbi:MAG TPA: aminopeptidase P N-terminal domain-containing protein [Acidimicrobiia bacterium]|nr:aminopeptidase P N-terminal domain-containing protein [Acidimicrobiia bacterium]
MSDPFGERRARLAEEIGDDAIAVIPAAVEVTRSNDTEFEFHQDPDFLYLTGFHEPEAIAVITPGHSDGAYTLFVRPRDPEMEAWNGYRVGTEGATERFGADHSYEVGQLDEILTRLMIGREVIWYRTGNRHHDDRIAGIVAKARSHRERYGGSVPSAVRDITVLLSEMRLIKSPEEIEIMRRACELSARGHAEAMRFAAPGLYEYQVQAALEYHWRLGGSRHNGYPSIVASGPNTCILHYVENDRLIENGDLILIDAAAEVEGYSADITRTFPANGVFSGPQRAIYEVVYSAFRKGLDMSAPGSSPRAIHDAATRVLTEGLVELGFLPKSVEESLAMHHYNQFYFHGTGHWLGLDVHDMGTYRVEGAPRKLEPGMAFTVEPGLYIAPNKGEITLNLLEYDVDEWNQRRILEGRVAAMAKEAEAKEKAEKITHSIPPEFLGIGIRIEDDVVITEDGHENLSRAVPSGIDEIEALCAESSSLPGPQAVAGRA